MSDYFESGFSVREPMWHGKGYVADRYPKDWEEAREWAGLTWEPILEPVYEKRPDGEFVEVEGWQRISRDDNGKTLGMRTDVYQLINHKAMGEIMEALLEQRTVKYETAGSVRGGRKVWALAYLDEPVTIPGDNSITLPFFAVTNHHDGKGGCNVSSTTVKIVCGNTFSAAEAEGERNGVIYSFKHRSNWQDRIEEARETITGVRRDFNRYIEIAEELLQVRVTPEQKELFVVKFIPAPPQNLISDRVMSNVETARDAVRLILNGPTSDGIGDTAWGLVQAAGEYLDHYRAYRTEDSYFTRQLLKPQKMKSKSIQLVREVVSAS